ncbi:hypothetical protein [Desulfovibrio sp. ZJ200]|uniref:hypothetical protein n=1 Tax=Desulfovibrio sp. ZJ200 TaxID=2709792 RepID=UPI0013EB4279|nr:hypothetical protein [Desulfovibrio sp. ZJ200]
MNLSEIAGKAKDCIGKGDSRFSKLAESSLQKMEDISESAEKELKRSTGNFEIKVLDGQRKARSFVNDDLKSLRKKPIIAKCVIYYEQEDRFEEFYICNGIPPTGIENIISYRSPKGRLAALDIGQYDLDEELGQNTQREIDITKVQGVGFKAQRINGNWDSIDTTYRDIFLGKNAVSTIEGSLRKWVQKAEGKEGIDILGKLLAADKSKMKILDGLKRDVLESMSLREQPILDSFQDRIFRMPLKSVLFLQGPAGSGKTTTLIRRLGQKLDIEHGLSEEEKELANNITADKYTKSWIMFTPTTLLKDYLKEAFNKEGIPAPDDNISTWKNYWTVLGRNKLHILRNANFLSGFEHDSDIKNILDTNQFFELYNSFISYLLDSYRSDIKSKLESLAEYGFEEHRKFIDDIKKSISRSLEGRPYIEDFLITLYRKKDEIIEINRKSKLKKEREELIRSQLNEILKDDNTFLTSFYKAKNQLTQEGQKEIENTDEIDTDDSMASDTEKDLSDTEKAYRAYTRFVISISKYKKTNKISTLNKKLSQILEEDKIPSDHILESIFILSQRIDAFKIFDDPIEKFFKRISSDYQKFRKDSQAKGLFYSQESGLKRKIDSAELDILILANLMLARKLIKRTEIKNNLSDGWLSSIREIFSCYKAQVYVDEAPDFSLTQLLCMRLLTYPETDSFFACGDFNQRITENGITSIDKFNEFSEQMKISGEKITQKKVLAPYRQTDSLYKFSLAVLKAMHGQHPCDYPEHSKIAAVGRAPVLGKNLEGNDLAKWIAERIREIEDFLGKIPSIAVLVPEEEDVRPLYKMLENELRSLNISVQPCYDGQTIGNTNAIRVFDIRHIKGVEFEAAFFISLDKLETKCPSLVGNYLYVGATRAATFLGVTYCSHMPKILAGDLATLFHQNWKK